MRLSVLCRTFRDDLKAAALALTSAKQYLPGAIEYVAVVPERHFQEAKSIMPSFVKVKSEAPQLHSDHIQQKLTTLFADEYAIGDYVFHLDSDTVFYRPVLRRDFFIFNKPLVFFDKFDNRTSQGRIHERNHREGTSHALGRPVEFDFSRTSDHLFHRVVYPMARAHLERTHNSSVANYLNTREARIRFHSPELATHAKPTPDQLFSDFSFLSAFLYYFQPGMMSWNYMGGDIPSPLHSLPYEYVQIRPQLLCQGDARLFGLPGKEAEYATVLQIMTKLATGRATSCGELEGYSAWVMKDQPKED
jgi:hypothetical protein